MEEEKRLGESRIASSRSLDRPGRVARSERAHGRRPRRALLAVIAASVVALGAVAVGGIVVGASPFAGLVPASVTCSITVHHENAANDAVQLAINAYPGGTICLGPGSFPEQLTIDSSGTTLHGDGATKTFIDPAGPLAVNTYDYDRGESAAAIILVEGTSGTPATGVSGVTVEDLGVNGTSGQSTFSNCSVGYFGVDYQASSGTLTESAIDNVALPTSLFGCQQGLAVYAYNGYFDGQTNFAPDTVTISHNSIVGFDKNAVTCDDPQETCTISSNSILGVGATALTAQNGVQVAFGAAATVSLNTIDSTGDYTGAGGCSAGAQGAYLYCSENEGAGILLFDVASGTSANSNTLAGNEYGIDYGADGLASDGYSGPVSVTISHNTIDSSSAYGIDAQGAPGGIDTVTISKNTINNEVTLDASLWGAPGILVDTGTFVISGNILDGSSTAAGASNGASEAVCGPIVGSNGQNYSDPITYCGSTVSLVTAAIEASSENGFDQTNVTLSSNAFAEDSNLIATLGVLGGETNLVET